MRFSRDKTVNDAVKRLLKGGWFVKSSNRHVRIENSVTGDVITVPGSPSCRRAVQNWLHQIKNRYGIEIATC